MSEGEVTTLRRAIEALSQRSERSIEALSQKTDRQHEENQKSSARDRETFAAAMNEQRQIFQEALNKQFLEHMVLERKVDQVDTKVTVCVGSGQPGEGRLGAVEATVETLKKFRWQALTVVSFVLLLVNLLKR